MNLRTILLALAALALPLPVAAQPAAGSAATEPQVLSTRFDPPLSKPLRYKVTQEREKAGKIEASAIEQEVSYRREGDGVVMTVRPVSITNGGKTLNLDAPGIPVPPTLKPLLETIELDLDADGAIVQVRNWDGFKAKLEASLPAILKATEPDPKKRRQIEPAIRQFFAKYLTVGPQGAAQLMLKGWPDLLGVMGASGPEGEDLYLESQAVTAFSPEPLRIEVTIKLTQVNAGSVLRIEVNSAPDPKAFRQLVRNVIDSMAGAAPLDKPIDGAEMERELSSMNLTMNMTVELDARTGLVRRAVMVRNVAMNEGSGTNRIIVEAQ